MKRIDFFTVKLVKEKGVLYDLEDKAIRSPIDAARLAREIFNLEEETSEHFCILTLNTKNKIIGAHTVHIGALNASIVHPRDSFQRALLNNAASIVMIHNHPSGDPTPSAEDRSVTERFMDVGNLLGIEVLDHIIMGEGTRYYSFRESGSVF